MIALLVSVALAGVPYEPGKYGKKCDKDLSVSARASKVLANIANDALNHPVSSTSLAFTNRLKAVRKKSKGYLCSRTDMLNAAIVLLTSGKRKDLNLSYQFATEAAKEGLDRSHYVATHSFDRFLVSRGLEQKYGTQFGRINGESRACIYPVDPAFTDEQRVAWSSPKLEVVFADFLAEKGHAGKPPNEQSMRRFNLMCISEKW